MEKNNLITDHHTESTYAIFIGIAVNIGITCVKFIAAYLSNSPAMFTEAAHSLVDATNQLLLLSAAYLERLPPSKKNPRGRDKESFFWGIIVASLLFSIGGVFGLIEGIHKLYYPEPLQYFIVNLSVYGVCSILEIFSLITCIQSLKKAYPHLTALKAVKETPIASLIVLFVEDWAAIIGLITAMLGLLLSMLCTNPMWDAIASIMIGLELIVAGSYIAYLLHQLMIGKEPSTNYEEMFSSLVQKFLPGTTLKNFIATYEGCTKIRITLTIHLPLEYNEKNYQQILNQWNALLVEWEKSTGITDCAVIWELD